MKTRITYLLITSVLFACSPNAVEEKEELADQFDFPVFIEERDLELEIVNGIWRDHGNHNPLYFGKFSDTVLVKPVYGRFFAPPILEGNTQKAIEIEKGIYDEYFLDWMDSRDYTRTDSAELKILIDTTQFISNDGKKAYPVMIENLHSDTIYIGYGRYIPIVAEALNAQGKWQQIEERFIYMCGNGVESIILPPKQIVVTSQLVYTGEFDTKIRIKLGSCYSNEYWGSINFSQFESEWDSRGNRKDVPNSK